jgi:hypothetical protein
VRIKRLTWESHYGITGNITMLKSATEVRKITDKAAETIRKEDERLEALIKASREQQLEQFGEEQVALLKQELITRVDSASLSGKREVEAYGLPTPSMRYMAMNSKAVEKFIEKLTQQGYTVEKINERVLETGRRAVFLSKLVVRW